MSPPRRFFAWYFGESGRRVFVWAVWAVMVGLAAGFVAQYGRNIPVNDEWAFVPDYFAPPGHQFGWLFERHTDHRYPLARGIFLACLHLSGYDFRAAQWVSLGVTAAAAACLVAAARRFRGTAEYTDCLYPVLLLHRGHCEDQLMGYQLAFTLTLLGVCGFVLAVALSRTRPRLLTAAGCAAVVALGGGAGVVFAPLLCGWVVWRGWRAKRWLTCGLAVAAFGYAAWAASDALRNPLADPKNPPTKAVGVCCEVAESTLGQSLAAGGVYGWAVLTAAGVLALVLLWQARRPDARPCALGLLAVLGGAGGFVAAIGTARSNGFAYRFSTFTQLLPVVGLLAAARFLPRRVPPVWVAAILTAVVAGLVVRQNWGLGSGYARRYVEAYEAAERDAASGVPIDLLAERNQPYFTTGFPQFWRTLWEHRVGPAAAAPPSRAVRTEPTTFREVPALDPRLPPPHPNHRLFAVAVPDDRPVLAVRVRFARRSHAPWEPFRLHWITAAPDGTDDVHFEILSPWTIPGEASTLIWVDGRLRGAWVELVPPAEDLDVTAVELLYPTDPAR